MIEVQLSDRLEADIRKLHDCLLELSQIEYARYTWVSAESVASELGRILERKEGDHGEETGGMYRDAGKAGGRGGRKAV